MFRTPLTADSDKWTLSSVLLIVGLCFLSYLFVLFEAQWIWDDPDYVWRNPLLAHEGGLAAIWRDAANTPQYYPVVHTSFWLELRALGMEADGTDSLPAGLFHFNNVLIFALTALMFWRVLAQLAVPGRMLAVLLFCVHPVNVESVAWVTERKNMLSGLFALCAVWGFLRFVRLDAREPRAEGDLVETPPPFSMGAWGGLIGGLVLAAVAFFPLTGQVEWMAGIPFVCLGAAAFAGGIAWFDRKRPREEQPAHPPTSLRWGALAGVLAFWVLGLLSKTVIAFVPPALILILWWKRPGLLMRPGVLLALFLLLIPGALAGLHTAWLEKYQVGADDKFFPEFDGLADRIMLAGTVVWVYLKHLVLPIEQMFFYPKWDPEVGSWWQWLLLISAVALPVTLLIKSKKWGRGPLVAVLIFGGALFPVMGFTNVYPMRFSWVADHFQYHANFAMFALLGALLARVKLPAGAARAAMGGLLVGGIALSNVHGFAFENASVLWQRTLASNPECWIAYQNLGAEKNSEARELRTAGNIPAAEKLEEEALALFQKALSFERDPNLLTSIAYAKLGRYRNARNPNPQDLIEAEAGIREAINEWGSISRMQAVLGDVLYTKGDYAGAYESYDTALVGMLNEGYLAEFTQEKLLSQTGRGVTSKWSTGIFEHGKQLLAKGRAAEALAIWQRPHERWGGEGTMRYLDLYSWAPTDRWFETELFRLWTLGAHRDARARKPQQALADFEWFEQQFRSRLQAGGITPDRFARFELVVIDLKAALMAGVGRFREAIDLSGMALQRARELNAPPAFVQQLAERNQRYRQKAPFLFDQRVPIEWLITE
ncbi:MAG: hypothetical protein CMJ94_07855 [Planctomycetes bacterium]|nr:hypothetical protein [Planctomycetota bacterium]